MKRASLGRYLALGAASMVLAAACSSSAGTATSAPSAAAPSTAASEAAPSASGGSTGEAVKVAFIAGQIGITFYTGVECGAKAAAKEFNVDLNWTGSHNWDINETRPLIDAAKATNPQGWVISPTDPDALVSDIKGFMEAKQWTVTIDAPMSQPVELQNIQSNHYEGGKTAAAAMLKLTGGTGTYLVLHMTPAFRSATWFGAESNATSLILPFWPAALIADAAPFAAVSCVA